MPHPEIRFCCVWLVMLNKFAVVIVQKATSKGFKVDGTKALQMQVHSANNVFIIHSTTELFKNGLMLDVEHCM